MADQLEAAKALIENLGGPTKVSESLGLHRSTVQRWVMTFDKGGRSGVIKSTQLSRLFALADSAGVQYDRADFVPRAGQI
ncbi:hypothetical protein DL1_08660 [Thioclava dalianensis]|uniref:Helix-turn-helix domain-containing protein n=1 Tax=Thioclava dalianensis TaxID=1185766 RepID=A0A074TF86_9RHOB|nr:helix-turn-helix domain-containing protein [Thioclava dalianensis]KEP68800.1 hypothetical protein DL1_08660 [Thioclava dalianensis]SFN49315.1 hypothetical protein SAMN05216224_10657 [Thioclava dalianensis]